MTEENESHFHLSVTPTCHRPPGRDQSQEEKWILMAQQNYHIPICTPPTYGVSLLMWRLDKCNDESTFDRKKVDYKVER